MDGHGFVWLKINKLGGNCAPNYKANAKMMVFRVLKNPQPLLRPKNHHFGVSFAITSLEIIHHFGIPTNVLVELIKYTFPSRDCIKSNTKNLNLLLSDFALACARMGTQALRGNCDYKTSALEIFKFISEEGVNLNELERICNNPIVSNFLKNNGLLN